MCYLHYLCQLLIAKSTTIGWIEARQEAIFIRNLKIIIIFILTYYEAFDEFSLY